MTKVEIGLIPKKTCLGASSSGTGKGNFLRRTWRVVGEIACTKNRKKERGVIDTKYINFGYTNEWPWPPKKDSEHDVLSWDGLENSNQNTTIIVINALAMIWTYTIETTTYIPYFPTKKYTYNSLNCWEDKLHHQHSVVIHVSNENVCVLVPELIFLMSEE